MMDNDRSNGARRDLVLVGGGHAHVQVLRRFAMEPPRSARITVVLDTPVAVYSGMVPGFVAGQYAASELEIDVVPLARRAGARVVIAPAVGVDAAGSRIELAGRAPLRYDVASLDVGSTVAGADLPGIRELALPSRPIGAFVRHVDDALATLAAAGAHGSCRVVVVGGGAGGVELAFTLQSRLRAAGLVALQVALLHSGDHILPGSSPSLRARTTKAAARRGIEIRGGVTVVGARAGAAVLEGGDEVPFDLLVWVTGAVAHDWLRRSGLPVDRRGFVRTRSTLQVEGHDGLFAVGDCAALIEHPSTPKAGVYAVREGPFLIDNLRAALEGGPLRSYTPQHDFLALLNLGDGTAVGGKWGRSFEGEWVMRLKDRIDRRFMGLFQVLDPDGAPAPEFPPMAEGMEMLCGGCAAKVGQSVLERALARVGGGDGSVGAPGGEEDAALAVASGTPVAARSEIVLGLDRADDAAVVRTPGGDLLASTVDLFSAFTDDPWLVGKVAAVNAVSDLVATGVEPRYALAVVAVPEGLDPDQAEEVLYQALAGARAGLDAAGVALLGGHTTTAPRLMVGFAVDGFAGDEALLLRLDLLRAGDRLVVTKGLGTGVVFHADMRALAGGRWLQAAIESATTANAPALRVLRGAGVRAVTDITGFGLAGHLGEMLRRSRLSARVRLRELPALPGALELLGRGLRSTFHAENERARRGLAIARAAASDPRLDLMFDPQTAGGLLFGVDADAAPGVVEELRRLGPAAVIGEVLPPREDGALIEIVP